MIVSVRVHPRSRRPRVEQHGDGSWDVWLRSPPVDGKANAELIDIIAATIGCRRSDVTIRTGASGTRKLIEITGPTDMIVSP